MAEPKLITQPISCSGQRERGEGRGEKEEGEEGGAGEWAWEQQHTHSGPWGPCPGCSITDTLMGFWLGGGAAESVFLATECDPSSFPWDREGCSGVSQAILGGSQFQGPVPNSYKTLPSFLEEFIFNWWKQSSNHIHAGQISSGKGGSMHFRTFGSAIHVKIFRLGLRDTLRFWQ